MSASIPNGKICYIQIPALDAERSAEFYETVFGWQIRRRGDGRLAFDDATANGVAGTWVTDRPASADPPGLLVYVMVDSVQETLEAICASGGEVVTPLTEQGPGEAVATFRDPAGNVLGIGQQP